VFVGDIDGKYPKPPAYEARKSIGEKR